MSEDHTDYRGSCLCGAVQFVITTGIQDIVHCHCSLCRKSSGTAYATNGFVATKGFHIDNGQADLTAYEYKPGKRRWFCSHCGSLVYSDNAADLTRIRIRVGLIDGKISERPIAHNFVSSRACWDDLDADLPRNDGFEEARQA